MKQSAVEWLFQELTNYYNLMSDYKTRQEILEKAKEMEKQQIIDAGNICALKQHLHYDRINKMSESQIRKFAEEEHLTFGEEYYNETFKNK